MQEFFFTKIDIYFIDFTKKTDIQGENEMCGE